MSSVSYKRDRARKRQIFLQTYKLASVSSSRKASSSQKLKKAVIKVKSAIVSILSFMCGSSLRSCNSKSAIEASSPRMNLTERKKKSLSFFFSGSPPLKE
ncbi:hypothetical protein RJ639_027708 [Escallonia herrerae]|uniref:Uncharacterized protein n=1 Tax=Escallonia herrerae TaxID=1293975 RepID=A0AA88X585_9ASTE|nr:hypothetical protein RJ639_027708 [Escallonia herrerae]